MKLSRSAQKAAASTMWQPSVAPTQHAGISLYAK